MFCKVSQKSIYKLFFIKLYNMETKTCFSEPLVCKNKSTGQFMLLVSGRLHLARYHPSQVYMNTIIMFCIMLITMVTCLARNSLNKHEGTIHCWIQRMRRKKRKRRKRKIQHFFPIIMHTCVMKKNYHDS